MVPEAITPPAVSSAISPSPSFNTSLSTSTVCSPSMGAGRVGPSQSLNFTGLGG